MRKYDDDNVNKSLNEINKEKGKKTEWTENDRKCMARVSIEKR